MASLSYSASSSSTASLGASPQVRERLYRSTGHTYRARRERHGRRLTERESGVTSSRPLTLPVTRSEISRRRVPRVRSSRSLSRSFSRSSRAVRSRSKKVQEKVVLDLTRENIARFYMAPKNELKFIGKGNKEEKSSKAHKQASKERSDLLSFAMGRLFEDLDNMYKPGSLDHLLPSSRR